MRRRRDPGRLFPLQEGEEPADRYVYDPDNPVPTRGGNTLGIRNGVYDQTEIEKRDDVLVYTGEVLESDLEVTGPLTMRLFAASSVGRRYRSRRAKTPGLGVGQAVARRNAACIRSIVASFNESLRQSRICLFGGSCPGPAEP